MARGERWLTRPVLAWALYDVACSTFVALVATFFGLFFVSIAANDLPCARGRWGAIALLALALAGVLALGGARGPCAPGDASPLNTPRPAPLVAQPTGGVWTLG